MTESKFSPMVISLHSLSKQMTAASLSQLSYHFHQGAVLFSWGAPNTNDVTTFDPYLLLTSNNSTKLSLFQQ